MLAVLVSMPGQSNARKNYKAEPNKERSARETSRRTRAELRQHRRGDRLDETTLGQLVLASWDSGTSRGEQGSVRDSRLRQIRRRGKPFDPMPPGNSR